MANRKNLKRDIRLVCTDLLAECVAASLYGSKGNEANIEMQLAAIVKLENHYIHRVSHVEPGMKAKAYFKNLIDKFNCQVDEIVDQVNYIN